MERSSVYAETTIPSAYVSHRSDPHSLARRQDTRRWWDKQRPNYEVLCSAEVILELAAADFPGQAEAIGLASDLPMLEINRDIEAISEVYVREHLMPGPAAEGDSLHMAIASYHEVDFLLTWNIRHLANPNKRAHLVVVNRRLGLLTPEIVTPETLWME